MTEYNGNQNLIIQSEVEMVFYGVNRTLKNGKNPSTDYPEYGPSLRELRIMPVEECRAYFRDKYGNIA